MLAKCNVPAPDLQLLLRERRADFFKRRDLSSSDLPNESNTAVIAGNLRPQLLAYRRYALIGIAQSLRSIIASRPGRGCGKGRRASALTRGAPSRVKFPPPSNRKTECNKNAGKIARPDRPGQGDRLNAQRAAKMPVPLTQYGANERSTREKRA